MRSCSRPSYLILAGVKAIYLSIALAAATLFSVGVFKGRLAAKPLFFSGMEFFSSPWERPFSDT